jgi:hypothetical protein
MTPLQLELSAEPLSANAPNASPAVTVATAPS